MKFHWITAPPQPALRNHLAGELGISPLLAQCLLNRGLSEPDPIQQFLEPRLKHLADPFLLPDMAKAVDRLWQAREQGEPLVIFGDYDVDGVTATALLHEVLNHLGWQAHSYLPNRMDDGYGLSQTGVEHCLAQYPVRLILAVDCGSNAVQTVAALSRQGIEVIVLDHHKISEPAPAALALVNPQASAPETPSFRELCSVGLAFKLSHALVKRGRHLGRAPETGYDIRTLLDLVALGTIADLVPLTGENRILISAGLRCLNRTQRPGLLALRDVAGIERPITGYEVGFQLAPRLNASGRLEDALESLRLLMAQDRVTADPAAARLDAHNRDRQEIERRIATEAIDAIRAQFDPARDYVLVEGQPAWHVGVVGIVASRVLNAFYRPTIILGGDQEAWRGSGRSIEGFDLAMALRECDDLLLRHGGHAMAAGLTVDPSNVPALRERLNRLARNWLQPEQLQPVLRLDALVCPSEMSYACVRELARLQQTGMGNPRAQFWMRDVTHERPLQRVGKERQHVKFWITDGRDTSEAIWWGGGQESLPVGRFDLAFHPALNEYRGSATVQLSVLDWRKASDQ